MSAMVGEAMDHMAKYLRYGKKDVYSPVITKFEWDGHDNAYWAFYGKEIAYALTIVKARNDHQYFLNKFQAA